MKILVLNCGSSSIKYQLMDVIDGTSNLLAKGLLDRIGLENGVLNHQATGQEKIKCAVEIPDHQTGINIMLSRLKDPQGGVIKSEQEIKAVGHRVAHGGENFKESVRINEEVKKDIERCGELAPLHNPAHLKGIHSIDKILPHVPQVAVFDTSFHQSMPEHAFLYAIPYSLYEKYKIRRYGFHGTSHKYVAQKACESLGKKFDDLKIITCHLGNGASITAIKNGKSADTSMGFTPIEGLMMGTRCGDLDIGAVLYLAEKEDLSIKHTNDLFNKKSGILGISGISSDMRDVETEAYEKNNHRAQLALDMYAYRVKKYVGAYAAAMGGVDLIVFTGGIGENDFSTRKKSMEGLEFLGIEINEEINHNLKGQEAIISQPNSKVTVMVYPTNEELVIAMDTYHIVNSQ